MFYHALTGNGGATPVENLEPVLLWTNSNPTASFAAQTVSLDLSDYAGVLVEYERSIALNNVISRAYVKKEDYDIVGFGAGNGGGYGSAVSAAGRNVKVNDNGVIFGSGYSTAEDNSAFIPVKIYGVKDYVIEPQIGDLLWTNPKPNAVFTGQKISVNLAKSKGVIVEFMLSSNTQIISSRQLLYKNDTMFGVGYIAGENATSRNITAIEDDGVTFSNGKSISSDDNGVLIPYKIYAIN